MKDDRVRYFADNMERLSRRDRVLLNNPVIMQGLGIAPIVIPATTLQNGWIMAVAVMLLLTPTRVIATIIGQRTGYKMRAVVYALTAGLVYVGVGYIMEYIFGTSVGNVGIYLPLLVLEPLIIKRYNSPKRERVTTSLKKGILTTVGFCLVILLMSSLREVLATGTLGGQIVFKASLLPIAAMPAGGFITLGFVVAVWRGLVNSFKKKISVEARHVR